MASNQAVAPSTAPNATTLISDRNGEPQRLQRRLSVYPCVYVKLNGNWVTVALQATLIQQAVSDCNLSYGQVTSVSNPKLAIGRDYMQGFRTTSWFGDQNDCDVSEARTFTRGDDDDGILVCVEPLYFMSTDGGISHGHFRSRNREARNYTTR